MLYNFLKIALRHLVKHKGYSALNIAGLATGMATAMLIGLWLHSEWTFDQYHANYSRIARVMQHQTENSAVNTQHIMPFATGRELKERYGSDFRYVVMATALRSRPLASGNRVLMKDGIFMEPEAPRMLSLKMRSGTPDGLRDPHSVLLSASAA